MPITPFLNGERFDPEDKRVLGVLPSKWSASLCGSETATTIELGAENEF